MKKNVDIASLKASKAHKNKVGTHGIVLKDSLCPSTDESCKRGCSKIQCKNLAP